MTPALLSLCIGFGVSLAIGQVLFKAAAAAIDPSAGIFFTSPLLMALGIYAATTVVWVYILTRLPLNVAYPFSLLGSALVPIFAHYCFDEIIGMKTIVGMALVLLGLVVIYAI